jgi:hypothetical protein
MRYARILLLLLIAIPFNSCKKEEIWPVKSTGVISPQGATTYQYGSHVLKDDAGVIIFSLTSGTVNLDDHLNKKVTVKGNRVKGYPMENGPELLDVRKVE